MMEQSTKGNVVLLDYGRYPLVCKCYSELFKLKTKVSGQARLTLEDKLQHRLLRQRCESYMDYLRSFPYRCNRLQIGAIFSGSKRIEAFVVIEFYEPSDDFATKRSAHISDIVFLSDANRTQQRRKLIAWAKKESKEWGAVTLTVSSGSQFWMDKGKGEVVQTKLYKLNTQQPAKRVVLPNSITLTKAKKSDLPVVARFIKRLFVETSALRPEFDFSKLKEEVLVQYLSDSSGRALKEHVLLLKRGDRPIGFIQYQDQWRDMETFSRSSVILCNIYLTKAERNKGLGSLLVERVEHRCWDDYTRVIRAATVHPQFFKGLGYRVWEEVSRVF
jgi:GNAT superfamily N-acetyltransferase